MNHFLRAISIFMLVTAVLLTTACDGDDLNKASSTTKESKETTSATTVASSNTDKDEGNGGSESNSGNEGNSGNESNNGSDIDISKLASKLVNSFGDVPDAWTFLPDSFSVDNYVVEVSGVPTYTDFTNVSAIPTNYIGKQMNVVVGMLNTCEAALGYVNTVYGALNIVESAYQAFINENPENYKSFSGNAGAFNYSITLDGKIYLLSASVENVNVTLFSDGEDSTYGARIQMGEKNVFKYTVTDRGLKIALNVMDSSSTQIEFVRDIDNTNVVLGYIYEYLTVGGAEIEAASTLLYSDENYTTVVGTKGDFIPTADSRNCEVYNSRTGKLVGTEVKETLGNDVKTYDTLWYNLSDIHGITTIKKADEYNGVNPDTIYINGKSDTIHTMICSLLDPSRRFDIEFKTVKAYTYDAQTEKYTSIEYEVPMMFIQESRLDSFADDYESKNDVAVSIAVSRSDREAVHNGYHTLVNIYNGIKNSVTQQNIIDYCSENFRVN